MGAAGVVVIHDAKMRREPRNSPDDHGDTEYGKSYYKRRNSSPNQINKNRREMALQGSDVWAADGGKLRKIGCPRTSAIGGILTPENEPRNTIQKPSLRLTRDPITKIALNRTSLSITYASFREMEGEGEKQIKWGARSLSVPEKGSLSAVLI